MCVTRNADSENSALHDSAQTVRIQAGGSMTLCLRQTGSTPQKTSQKQRMGSEELHLKGARKKVQLYTD